MSGPKKWVPSKGFHRKTSSRSNIISSNLSGLSLVDDGLSTSSSSPHPTPFARLPPDEDGTTAPTAIVEFGGSDRSTLMNRTGGSSSVEWSNDSSIDSTSTGLPSPSTTPPKKIWETNYKSFLRGNRHASSANPPPGTSSSTSRQQQHAAAAPTQLRLPIKPGMRTHPNNNGANNRPNRARTMSYNFLSTAVAATAHHHHHHAHDQACPPRDAIGDDSRPSLADGFDHHDCDNDNSNRSDYFLPLSVPPPNKNRESGSARGGTFFKRLHSASGGGGSSKSVDNLNLDMTMRRGMDKGGGGSRGSSSDVPVGTPPGGGGGVHVNLDATMRRGHDRKSPSNTPSNTPPGSAVSTPIKKLSTLQEGMMKIAATGEAVVGDLLHLPLLHKDHRRISSQGGGGGGENCNALDRAIHRGLGTSSSSAQITSSAIPHQRAGTTPPPQLVYRTQSVASMGVNVPEGGGGGPSGGVALDDDEEYIRDRRKAFTDFHSMGVDSSSAYLGDELSLHKNSVFLSSMAYPAGSAGGKASSSRHSFTGGSRSLDQKRNNISPSTSLNSISETKSQHPETDADILPEPERSLRSLKGPEHWTKGERHAIIPGVLCMCPIQVLNNVMSEEEGCPRRPSLPSSLGSQRGFGIGSILQDESGDSNGWFFADHHQPTTVGGSAPLHGGGSIGSGNSVPSAFGKILLGKATVAPIGMRSFLNELYGWCTGVFVLRQNYLFEYREGDSQNGLPWGYAHLPFAEAYPHKHFINALHLDFFERPCYKAGKRSLLLRVESKHERDRWISLLQSASRMTIHDLYDVDESDGAIIFGEGRYAKVRPAKRKDRQRSMSFSGSRLQATKSQESLWNNSSNDGKSSTDLAGAMVDYQCALKIIDKTEFWTRVKRGRERADTLVREAAVQTTLTVLGAETSGLLRVLNIFETSEHLVLELELLKGIDLFQHISSRGVLDEVEAAHIMRDVLNCLNVLDRVGVAHRDIKPANLLMCHDENSNGSRIKLADYGMASFVGVDNLVRGRCGTPGFVAPEILLTRVNGGYGNKVDMFSAGVTLYVMLAGYEPFYGESDEELIDANKQAKVDFPHADWHKVSVEGRDLIERMLTADPLKRIGPSEALRHPWITRRVVPRHDNVDFDQASCTIC